MSLHNLLIYFISSAICFSLFACNKKIALSEHRREYAIVIHGGAGTISRKNITVEQEAAYRAGLQSAIEEGQRLLALGKPALEVVIEVIKILEDNPLFNAGKGAVFTHDGRNELDASIMDGQTLKAGAIGGVTNVKNPITGALAVMNQSPHVFLVGRGAEEFCALSGCTMVDPSYFYTESRWQALQKALKEDSLNMKNVNVDQKRGTVGCVVLDKYGHLAAGTSTGGMTNKKYGRIGDAPIIGGGTYADDATCAVSCTGHGEYFIRYTVARSIAAMIEYGHITLDNACQHMVHEKLKAAGGEGGLIAVDAKGNIVTCFNTEGMYRAWAIPGKTEIKIFKD